MIIKPFFRKAQKRMIMKRIFIVMAALMLVCSTGQAQTYLKNSLKNLRKEAQKPENTAKVYHNPARYEEVSFITPNAEGQRLFYKILPENNHTVAIIRPEEKKDRYNDASYIIPSSVSYNGQTYTVTEIGREAFNNSKARSVTLPSTLKYIAAWAFTRTDRKNDWSPCWASCCGHSTENPPIKRSIRYSAASISGTDSRND